MRWSLLPFAVIGVAALANVGLIAAGARVRPESVEDRPYLASMHVDEDIAADRRFVADGLTLNAAPRARGVDLRLDGLAGTVPATVTAYRPDDRASDRTVAWADATRPLPLTLPHSGVWLICVRVPGPAGERTASTRIDLPR